MDSRRGVAPGGHRETELRKGSCNAVEPQEPANSTGVAPDTARAAGRSKDVQHFDKDEQLPSDGRNSSPARLDAVSDCAVGLEVHLGGRE